MRLSATHTALVSSLLALAPYAASGKAYGVPLPKSKVVKVPVNLNTNASAPVRALSAKASAVTTQATTTITAYNFYSENNALTINYQGVALSAIGQGAMTTATVNDFTASNVDVYRSAVQIYPTTGGTTQLNDANRPCASAQSYLNTMFIGTSQQIASSPFVQYPSASSVCTVPSGSVRLFITNQAIPQGTFYYSEPSYSTTISSNTFILSFLGTVDQDNTIPVTLDSGYTYVTFRPLDGSTPTCNMCTITSTSQSPAGAAYIVGWSRTDTTFEFTGFSTGSGVTVTCATTSTCITTSGSYSVSTSSSSGSVCFEGNQKVSLESGAEKPIKEVVVGDVVQVASKSGELSYAPVVFIPHGSNSVSAKFVHLQTEKKSLKLTPDHLILAANCDVPASLQLIPAKLVKSGMCVESVDGFEAVVESNEVEGEGIYTIVTSHTDGRVIINGIKASSFAHNHDLVNAYYHIHRFFYNVLPSSFFSHSATVSINQKIGELAAWLWL